VEVSACRGKASGSLLSQDMHAATSTDESVCMEIKSPPTSSEPKNVSDGAQKGLQSEGELACVTSHESDQKLHVYAGAPHPAPGDRAAPEWTTSQKLQRLQHTEIPAHRVFREIALLKGLRSQYIVGFHGACFQDREVMLVTELMPGGDLWSALRAGEINWWNG
jgi:hypothetical protein